MINHDLNIPHCRTWLIDLDGTIVKHNGYLHGPDELLPGVSEFWRRLPAEDLVIILSARPEQHRVAAQEFLAEQGLRYDHLIFGLSTGERVLINDCKPDGTATARAVNVCRDGGLAEIK